MASKSPTIDQALDDVEARFLLNLPETELAQADRLFFQIEQAYWYYEDFKADFHPTLPHFKSLKLFAKKIFEHCSLLSRMQEKFRELFLDFSMYRAKIPVCGCIMLNAKMNKVLLVCDWGGGSWMFPRGKINEGEIEFDCAIREVIEEIGYDPTKHCKEEDSLTAFQDGKKLKMYIATNVPENAKFKPKSRKEISKIEFHHLDFLPKNSFGIQPFLPKLKRWMSRLKKMKSPKPGPNSVLLKSPSLNSTKAPNLPLPPKGGKNARSNSTDRPPRDSSSSTTAASAASQAAGNNQFSIPANPNLKASPSGNRRGGASSNAKLATKFDQRNSDTFEGDSSAKGWTVADMFSANSKLTGFDYQYDGNPHDFGSVHPRFTNYNAPNSPLVSEKALKPNNNLASTTFSELSQQSMEGYRMMSRERGRSEPDLLKAAESESYPSVFNLPFPAPAPGPIPPPFPSVVALEASYGLLGMGMGIADRIADTHAHAQMIRNDWFSKCFTVMNTNAVMHEVDQSLQKSKHVILAM